ncbi:hypothetical protein ACHQM5_014964 [Ranunculus cassubicifolius]
MNAQSEEILNFQTTKPMTLCGVVRKSFSIAKTSPKTFFLIILTLILPLSFAILAHSEFSTPLLDVIPTTAYDEILYKHHSWLQFFIFIVGYPMFLFIFSLLSTAAVVFTAASLYTRRPVSFVSTLRAIPRVFKRLFITFLFISLLMLLYIAVSCVFLVTIIGILDVGAHPYVFCTLILSLLIVFLMIHIYITAIWHLASVVSVLEPVYGLAAMKKSKKLLTGKKSMGITLVFAYLTMCVGIEIAYSLCNLYHRKLIRYSLRALLVGVLVIVNFVGLLVQSVFYFVCKSYHGEEIDKSVLYESLGGYVGEYVRLRSSTEMKNAESEMDVKEMKKVESEMDAVEGKV